MSQMGQSRRFDVHRPLPVYPNQRTFSEAVVMSQKCTTTEVASHLFDNSVREGEKGRRYIQAKRSCRLQIDDEFELCRLLDG
jgi:hypothetical protein